jgi:hypothetical protein
MSTKTSINVSVRKATINLYLVTTLDHDEDWFIFARTSRSAASYHEHYEGYDTGDAKAGLVIARVKLPKCEQGPPPCHAQIADLIALGFDVVGADPYQRGVRFKGKLYVEGCLQSLIVQGNASLREAAVLGRPNGTKRSTKPK